MSDDLLGLIKQTWDRIYPELQKNPDELKRRLARRRIGMMNRPPRAWCLAVRAADTRINPATALIVPEVAGYAGSHLKGVEPRYDEHEVTLNARLLRKLCRAVRTDEPYSTADEMMKKLGCSKHNMRAAIRMGVFSEVRKIKSLNGKWGWPVTTVYSKEPLDPGSRLRKHADPVWGTMWRYVNEHIPDDLEQTIRRVPERRGAVLPGMMYTGWKWICPGCGKPCRTIFYPLPPLCWVQLLEKEFHDTDPGHPDALSKGNNTFACMKCHQVLYFSRFNYVTWNQLVSHLSGGLLFGNEVPKPSGYVEHRTRAFHPILRREPSKRREQIQGMILKGLGITQLARELGLRKSTVGTYASNIYRRNGVKGITQLREKLKRVGDDGRSADNDAGTGAEQIISDKCAEVSPLGGDFG